MRAITVSGPVLLPDNRVVTATVYIDEGKIERIEPGGVASPDLRASGLLAPGFIDLQVNGAYGVDLTTDPGRVGLVAERLTSTGVTAFLPTMITSEFSTYRPRLDELRAAWRDARGAQVLGVHLEGPYISPKRHGAHDRTHLRPIGLDEIVRWADPSMVRLVTLAPELPGALGAIQALAARGIVVSAGHSDATFDQARAGFAAGISWGTHLFNAMSELGHRRPGLSGALLTSSIPCGLIPDGYHVHPAAVDLAYRAKGPGGLSLVTDAMAAMGTPPGAYKLAGREVIVDEQTARLPDGTLAGSILPMDQAVRNMIAFTSCSPAAAITMASRTPADVLRLAHKGRIVPGCDADLVLLDPDRHVTHTIVCGHIAYP